MWWVGEGLKIIDPLTPHTLVYLHDLTHYLHQTWDMNLFYYKDHFVQKILS